VLSPNLTFAAASTPRRTFNTVSVLMLSTVISVSLLLLMNRFEWYVVLAGALLFFGASIIALMGDIANRLIYSIFLIQITASLFLQFTFYITLIGVIFLPSLFFISKNLDKIGAVPCCRSLLLLLSGWLIALTYSNVFAGGHKYFLLEDIHLLLGFGVAYLVYFMLTLEYLNMARLIRYTTFSGLVFIGIVLVKYAVNGYAPPRILNDRFGLLADVNPNFVSLYIGMTLPCAFFPALFETRDLAKKFFLYAISAFYLCIIVITGSRGALFGVAALIAYFLWHKRSIKWVLAMLAGLGTVIAAVGQKYLYRALNPSMSEIVSDLGRIELLKAAFTILKENYFFFGIGMDSFAPLKMNYGVPVWFPSPGPAENLSSHNVYVEVWLGWGLLGLLGWLAFNIGIIYALLRCKEEKYNWAAKGIAFAMISFMLYSFVDSNIGNVSMMFTYFSLVGAGMFIIAQTNYASSKSNNARADFDQSSP